MNEKIKELNQFESVALLSQLLLSFFVIVFTLIAIGEPWAMLVTKILLTALFLLMAFNNIKIFKRKGFSYLYIMGAIIMIISIVMIK